MQKDFIRAGGGGAVAEGNYTKTPISIYHPQLQQLAGQLLLSTSRTCSIAQRLYEQGHIPYENDSISNLEKECTIKNISGSINKEFGEKYLSPRDNLQKNQKTLWWCYITTTNIH